MQKNLNGVWDTVKDRPTGEFLNYLNDRCKHGNESTYKDFFDTMAYAVCGMAAVDFAIHIKGEK